MNCIFARESRVAADHGSTSILNWGKGYTFDEGDESFMALYQEDSYMKERDATIISVKDGKYVVLDQTIFCPKGGGLPHDLGKIICGDEFNVVYVGRFSGEISHEVDHAGLAPDRQVHCVLDWERRNRLMRSHTASHTLASILWKETGALVTGNQIELDKVRFDFSLEIFDREIFQTLITKANGLFRRDIPVKWYELPREEALKIPGIIKMAEAFPPEVERLRIVVHRYRLEGIILLIII